MGSRLGEEVRPVLSSKDLRDPDSRAAWVARELVKTGTLSGGIRIPNTVGPIQLTALLRGSVVQASIEVESPDLKRSSARLNWLLRQLQNAPPELRIDVRFLRTSRTASDLLFRVVEDPKGVLDRERTPRSFILTLSESVGMKRKAGRGGFITDVSALLDRFYREVVQSVTAWTPAAPKLSSSVEEEAEPETGGTTQPDQALPEVSPAPSATWPPVD